MGKARLMQLRGQHKDALEQLNQVIVQYAWFLPALVEKFGVLMAMGDWEQAIETAQRVLAQDQHNIEALRMSGIFLLCQESRTCAVATRTLRLQRPTAGHPTRPRVSQLSPSTASRICSRPSTGTNHKTRRSFGAFLGHLRASLDGTLGCCSSPCSCATAR